MMIILNKDTKLATIKEVGEDDIKISYMDNDYTVSLTEENKNIIHNLVTDQGMFSVAFDLENNRLLMDSYREQHEESLYETYLKEEVYSYEEESKC